MLHNIEKRVIFTLEHVPKVSESHGTHTVAIGKRGPRNAHYLHVQKWEPIYAHYQNAAKVSEKQDAFINNKDKPGQNRREPKYSIACFPLIFGLFCQFHVPKGSRHLSEAIVKTKTERYATQNMFI